MLYRALELCLGEVAKCQLFVGILGDRYGWIPSRYELPSTPEFQWIQSYPPGASVTELEINHAALANPAAAQQRAFFYLRNNAFLRFAVQLINYIVM